MRNRVVASGLLRRRRRRRRRRQGTTTDKHMEDCFEDFRVYLRVFTNAAEPQKTLTLSTPSKHQEDTARHVMRGRIDVSTTSNSASIGDMFSGMHVTAGFLRCLRESTDDTVNGLRLLSFAAMPASSWIILQLHDDCFASFAAPASIHCRAILHSVLSSKCSSAQLLIPAMSDESPDCKHVP